MDDAQLIAAVAKTFDEEAHPRVPAGSDKGGEFTSGGVGTGGAKGGWKAETLAAEYREKGTQARAFKAWFGDWQNAPEKASKVVKADGTPSEQHEFTPVKVYHGTPVGGWTKFDPEKDKGANLYGKGFYFTEDREIAQTYITKDATVPEAHLKTIIIPEGDRKQYINDYIQDIVGRQYRDAEFKNQEINSVTGAMANFLKTGSVYELVRQSKNNLYPNSVNDPLADKGEVAGTWVQQVFALEKKYGYVTNPRSEVKECYLNIRKPFDLDKPATEADFDALMAYAKTQNRDFYWKHIFDEIPKEIKWFEKKHNFSSDKVTWENAQKLAQWLHEVKPEIFPDKTGRTMTWQGLARIMGDGNFFSSRTEVINGYIRSLGHDGMSHTGGWNIGAKAHKVWIAFEPTQIKATGNSGRFNPKNADIMKSDAAVIAEVAKTFDPDQPRDESGRWTTGGGSSHAGSTLNPQVKSDKFQNGTIAYHVIPKESVADAKKNGLRPGYHGEQQGGKVFAFLDKSEAEWYAGVQRNDAKQDGVELNLTIVPVDVSGFTVKRDFSLSSDDDDQSTAIVLDVKEGKVRIYKSDAYLIADLVKSERWGTSGSGVLYICPEDGTMLLFKRSWGVKDPGTWGITGGAIKGTDGLYDASEITEEHQPSEKKAWQSAKTETKEELGVIPSGQRIGQTVFKDGNWQYTTFIVAISSTEKKRVDESAKLNWENDECKWYPVAQLPSPLHFGVKFTLDNFDVSTAMQGIGEQPRRPAGDERGGEWMAKSQDNIAGFDTITEPVLKEKDIPISDKDLIEKAAAEWDKSLIRFYRDDHYGPTQSKTVFMASPDDKGMPGYYMVHVRDGKVEYGRVRMMTQHWDAGVSGDWKPSSLDEVMQWHAEHPDLRSYYAVRQDEDTALIEKSAAEWDESKHPRATDGKFTDGQSEMALGDPRREPSPVSAGEDDGDVWNKLEFPKSVEEVAELLKDANPVRVAGEVVDGVFILEDDKGERRVVEWDGRDKNVSTYDPKDYIWERADRMVEDVSDKLAAQFSKDFAESPGVLFHATTEENAESIEKEGLEPRSETRGLTNRSVGEAVYTTENEDSARSGTYGDVVFRIDLEAMKKDGVPLPEAEKEPAAFEYEARESVAYALGVEDFHQDGSGDGADDPETVVLHGSIPAKYLKRITGVEKADRSLIEELAKDWDESEHPRAKDGEFTTKGGESSLPWSQEKTHEVKIGGATVEYDVFPEKVTLNDLYVPAESRGKGAATSLMNQLVSQADATGKQIELMAFDPRGESDDSRLEDFYKRFGFRIVGRDDGAAIMRRDPTPKNASQLKLSPERIEELKKDPTVFWHGTASGDLRGGTQGLHVGTYKAATQALEATIGIPAEGTWDGTREYGKTLLMGSDRQEEREKQIQRETGERYACYGGTGYNCGGPNYEIPRHDFYPSEKPDKEKAHYSNGELIPLTVKPAIFPLRIKQEAMANTPRRPMSDGSANAAAVREKKKFGGLQRGHFYRNEGEDSGSISAVLPNEKALELIVKSEMLIVKSEDVELVKDAEFEAGHPRGEGGKFVDKGAGESTERKVADKPYTLKGIDGEPDQTLHLPEETESKPHSKSVADLARQDAMSNGKVLVSFPLTDWMVGGKVWTGKPSRFLKPLIIGSRVFVQFDKRVWELDATETKHTFHTGKEHSMASFTTSKGYEPDEFRSLKAHLKAGPGTADIEKSWGDEVVTDADVIADMVAKDASFEAEHPRKEDGEFAPKGEGVGGGKPKLAGLTPYDKAVQANINHMATKATGEMGKWSEVPIVGFVEVDDGTGTMVKMPKFKYPEGYTAAPTLYPSGGDGLGNCEWCGHPIKIFYHIQNDSQKWTMGVGSECITQFTGGKSGKDMEKEVKQAENRQFLKDVNDRHEMLKGIFQFMGDRGYGRREVTWRNSDAAKLSREYDKIVGSMKAVKRGAFGIEPATDTHIQGWVTRKGDTVRDWMKKVDALMTPATQKSAREILQTKIRHAESTLSFGRVQGREMMAHEKEWAQKEIDHAKKVLTEFEAMVPRWNPVAKSDAELIEMVAKDAEFEAQHPRAADGEFTNRFASVPVTGKTVEREAFDTFVTELDQKQPGWRKDENQRDPDNPYDFSTGALDYEVFNKMWKLRRESRDSERALQAPPDISRFRGVAQLRHDLANRVRTGAMSAEEASKLESAWREANKEKLDARKKEQAEHVINAEVSAQAAITHAADKYGFKPAETVEQANAVLKAFGLDGEFKRGQLGVANSTNAALTIAKSNGDVLPKNIAVIASSTVKWGARFRVSRVSEGLWTTTLEINTSKAHQAAWVKQQDDGWWSQSNPMLHELGHAYAFSKDPAGYYKDCTTPTVFSRILGQVDDKIASKVSKYATTSAAEFVAETYAGLRAGKTYDDDVMNLFKEKTTPKATT